MDELSVQERAEKTVASLDPTTPVLVRIMKPSQVSGGFWMGLVKKFCVDFMSEEDIFMTLVNEQGRKFDKITYLARSNGLSGGWKGFAETHGLREGDAVIFQLINVQTFKIFIVRKDGEHEIDGALQEQENCRGGAGKKLKTKKNPARRLPLAVVEGNDGENLQQEIKPTAKRQRRSPLSVVQGVGKQTENLAEQRGASDNSIDVVVDSELTEDVRAKYYKLCDNNSDVVVDSKLPEHVKTKYYKLCCSRNSLLHTNLLSCLDCELVTDIISETVKIADAIRSFKPSNTSKDKLAEWKTSLEEFEKLGMKVAFMIPRIDEFMKLYFISRRAVDPKGSVVERKAKKACEMKLLESKDVLKKLEFNIRSREAMEFDFEAAMSAPW